MFPESQHHWIIVTLLQCTLCWCFDIIIYYCLYFREEKVSLDYLGKVRHYINAVVV